MCLSNNRSPLKNSHGFGLVAAIFMVVILAMFGVLVAKNITTTTIASVDDYRWAQALYSAESTAHLMMLFHDNGGGLGAPPNPVVQNVDTTVLVDALLPPPPSSLLILRVLSVKGEIAGTSISRTVEVKYILN